MPDPAFYAMGSPQPSLEEIWSPLRDVSVAPSELGVAFATWVSGYYHHDQLHTSIFPNLSRAEILSRLAQHPPSSPPPSERPTIGRMTPETLASVADLEGTNRSHIPIADGLDRNVYAKNLRAALLQHVLRDVRFELVWCEMALPDTGFASWLLADKVKELDSNNPRSVRMWTFEGSNHFVS